MLEESARLVVELSERMFHEGLSEQKHRLPVGQMSLIMSLHVHHTKMNFNIKLWLFPQFLLSIYNVSHYLISPPFFLFPLLLIKCKKTHSKGAVYT